MLIGFTTDQYRKFSIPMILRILRWWGVSFSEVTVNVFNCPEKAFQSAQCMKYGLHLPNFVNFGFDFSSKECQKNIEFVLNQIKKYKKMFNFQYAVFHPPEEDSAKASFDYYIQNLRCVEIPLVLENSCGYTINQFIKFYHYIKEKLEDRVHGLCVDIPHFYLEGEDWVKAFRLLGSKVKVIHLSNCADGKDLHFPFSVRGDLSLEEILQTLQREKFEGILNFEIRPPSLWRIDTVYKTYLQARNLIG